MPAIAFDIQNPELVARDLAEANRHLAKEETTPLSILDLLSDLCEQIGETRADKLTGISPDDWMAVQSAALRTQTALRRDDDEEKRRNQLRLLIEELRFRFARLAERQLVAEDRPITEVVRWLDSTLTVPQSAKGELFAVSDRTWQRWVSESETSQPADEDERQVRLVARVVGELRFLLTTNGVVVWLHQPDPALQDRSPLDVIRAGERGEVQALFGQVAAARSGAAA